LLPNDQLSETVSSFLANVQRRVRAKATEVDTR
jgi:hypothetical protein